jgi:endonuclease-3 related protein
MQRPGVYLRTGRITISAMTTAGKLMQVYELLLERFGPQHWWPGESRFEIIAGAVLTQNTNWTNVEKAINNLKQAGVLAPEALRRLPAGRLEELVRPAGYWRLKAQRLKNLLEWLFEGYGGDLKALDGVSTSQLRQELLSIKGIGPETADSILLYALDREAFVIDTYTARVACRHALIDAEAGYEQLKELFESNLPADTRLFNEYHALLVRAGKEYCRPQARCEGCPLEALPHNV